MYPVKVVGTKDFKSISMLLDCEHVCRSESTLLKIVVVCVVVQ